MPNLHTRCLFEQLEVIKEVTFSNKLRWYDMNANKKNVTTVCPVLKMSTGKKEGSLPAISHECGNSMQFECKEGPIYIYTSVYSTMYKSAV